MIRRADHIRPLAHLQRLFLRAATEALPAPLAALLSLAKVSVSPSKEPGFDYQLNSGLQWAKETGTAPDKMAQRIVEAVATQGRRSKHHLLTNDVQFDAIGELKITGPGFVNVRLCETWLARHVEHSVEDGAAFEGRLAVRRSPHARRVLVDHGSPNVGKELHVGHMRSTIIGDALHQVLRFRGHSVARVSHVGDFGMPVAKVIAAAQAEPERHPWAASRRFDATQLPSTAELGELYASARELDEERVGQLLVDMQRLEHGTPEVFNAWRAICMASNEEVRTLFEKLGVWAGLFEQGESSFAPVLPAMLDELQRAGIVTESRGALVALADSEHPVVMRRANGSYLYATTDVAAMRHRSQLLKRDWIIVVTDVAQRLHFEQVRSVAERAGYLDESRHRFDHVAFGQVRSPDTGKQFSSRDGSTVLLQTLLDTAVARVRESFDGKNPNDDIADDEFFSRLGIGALKYWDLNHDRLSNYTFSYDKMLALQGNTALYIQYTYARTRSVLRTAYNCASADEVLSPADEGSARLGTDLIKCAGEVDRALLLKLLQFNDAIFGVEETLCPHHLCTYLHQLAHAFNLLYQNEKIIGSENEASRLRLCLATGRVLSKGLELMGIETVEKV